MLGSCYRFPHNPPECCDDRNNFSQSRWCKVYGSLLVTVLLSGVLQEIWSYFLYLILFFSFAASLCSHTQPQVYELAVGDEQSCQWIVSALLLVPKDVWGNGVRIKQASQKISHRGTMCFKRWLLELPPQSLTKKRETAGDPWMNVNLKQSNRRWQEWTLTV